MEIGKIGWEFLTGVTGNTGKALLCVFAYPKGSMKHIQDEKEAEKHDQATKEVLKMARDKLGSIYGLTDKPQKAGEEEKKTASYRDAAKKAKLATLEVDYNPSSITFRAQNGTTIHKGISGSEDTLVSKDVPPQVMMHVDLVFDDMNLKDSFMWEKFRLSVGDIVSSVQGVRRRASNKGDKDLAEDEKVNGYTVQIPIDGIVALINHMLTRQIMFIWNKMIFAGELISVNARYTMFNQSGNPVRGVVTLSIQQGQEMEMEAVQKYWDKAFDKLFKVDEKKRNEDSSAVSSDKFSKVGSLIQL